MNKNRVNSIEKAFEGVGPDSTTLYTNQEIVDLLMELQKMQIASLNGHLCHIWRPACDLNGGQPRTH